LFVVVKEEKRRGYSEGSEWWGALVQRAPASVLNAVPINTFNYRMLTCLRNSSCRFKSDKLIQLMWRDSEGLDENVSRNARMDVTCGVCVGNTEQGRKFFLSEAQPQNNLARGSGGIGPFDSTARTTTNSVKAFQRLDATSFQDVSKLKITAPSLIRTFDQTFPKCSTIAFLVFKRQTVVSLPRNASTH
jgi:hypothetical protein